MNEERTGKCLRQVEHIRGHLLNVKKSDISFLHRLVSWLGRKESDICLLTHTGQLIGKEVV